MINKKYSLNAICLFFFIFLCNLLNFQTARVFAQEVISDSLVIVILNTKPSDAEVFVDSVYKGNTPIIFSVDKKQRHLMKIEFPEYVSLHHWISQSKDTVNLDLKLVPNYSWIRIEPTSPDTRILVNDSLNIPSNMLTRVPVGIHKLKLENYRKDRLVNKIIKVNPGDTINITANLGANSFFPVIQSAILPGAGQLYDGAFLKGLGFFIGTASSLYLEINAKLKIERMTKEYQSSYDLYLKAVDEETAVKYKRETLSKLDEINLLTKKQNWLLGITLGLYIINIIDAVLFHRVDDFIEFDSGQSNVRISPLISKNRDQIQAGISINF